MNRRHFLYAPALLGAGASYAATETAATIKTRIARATAAALAMQRRDWEQGTLAQAFLEAGDNANVILLTKAAMVQKTPDGRLGVVGSGGPTDPAMGGEAYLLAAKLTGDPAIQTAVQGMLDYILKTAPRAPDGTLYHVFNNPQVWSDGFFSSPPFLAAAGQYDEALRQIDGFRKRLWNPQKKMLSHIWDDGKQGFNDAAFWGSGNGWAAAGLARVIRSLPADRKDDRARLAAFVKDIVDGCLAFQRPDGLFHDKMDRPDSFVETNAAQMLAFAIYTGVHGGWLPREYAAKADRMRDAARAKVDQFGYVQGACGAPGFNRPGTSTEAQSFFIMMEAAGAKK
jgi:rhamnogalacturonyl hydrolase YesR